MMKLRLKNKPIVKIDNVIQDGEFEFNKMLLKYFPQSESGEEDIALSIEWSVINAQIIETWWRLNASHLYDLQLSNGTILRGADEK